MPTITISYGYDIHRIRVDEPTFVRINRGNVVEVDGQGFGHEEDGLLIDHWVFNNDFGKVMFWLDNGAEYHGQEVWVEDSK